MQKIIYGILLVSFIFPCFSQIKFEPGYFIDNDGNKTECLIRNQDWKNNPNNFTYKLTETGEPFKRTTENTKEFGIDGFSKYIRFSGEIDKSTDYVEKMDYSKNPSFEVQTMFLEFVIEGTAILYYYEDRDLERFFYSYENAEIKQLVYKRYKTPNDQVATNNLYKRQLATNLRCDSISIQEIEELTYNIKSLSSYFQKFNDCASSQFTNYYTMQMDRIDMVNLYIRPGVYIASMDELRPGGIVNNISNKAGYRIGVELEVVPTFNAGKWAISFEPTFQSFSGQINHTEPYIRYINYNSIELSLGIKYAPILTDNIRLYLSGGITPDAPLGNIEKVDLTRNGTIQRSYETSEGNFSLNPYLGLGIQYLKFNVELRKALKRDILNKYTLYGMDYYYNGIIIGYQLF